MSTAWQLSVQESEDGEARRIGMVHGNIVLFLAYQATATLVTSSSWLVIGARL